MPSNSSDFTLSGEHLNPGKVEQLALDPVISHLASCAFCQNLVVQYAETGEHVPLGQYPSDDVTTVYPAAVEPGALDEQFRNED